MTLENKPIPDRVLRYDGRVDNPQPPACLECKTVLQIEQFDAGYCDEVCERLALMKRISK